MAQPDAKKSSPSPLVKVLIAIAVALGATGGADAAGYTPDFGALKDLGLGGAVMLILYFELRAMPVALRIAARDDREQAAEIEATRPAFEPHTASAAYTATAVSTDPYPAGAIVPFRSRTEPP